MKEETDAILRRIQKLFALAGNNPSESEAEAAMLKAQELLLSNGLSMKDVDHYAEPNAKRVEERDTDLNTKRLKWWQIKLANVIGNNFRCYVLLSQQDYVRPKTSLCWCPQRYQIIRTIRFIGLERDVDAAVQTYNFAFRAAKQLWKKWWADQKNNHDDYLPRGFVNQLRRDYMIGFVSGLKAKYEEQVETKALIIKKDKVLVDYHEAQRYGSHHSNFASGRSDSAAGQAGYHDGHSLGQPHRSLT